MLNRTLLILIFVTFSLPAIAQTGADYFFEQGNKAYRAENYAEAVEWYQKILATGYESPELQYNLGNSYYKLGDTGRAILHYEKALKLKPDDAELKFNLELANLKVRDRIVMPESFVFLRWWVSLKHAFSLSGWTYLTVIFYLLGMTGGIIYLFVNSEFIRRILKISIISLTVLTICAGLLLTLNILDESSKEAIVLTSTINVLSAPEENSTEVFLLHEGAKVSLAEQRDDWVKIILPDGKSGWMKAQYLGVI